jgi:hypothetical protein
MHERSFVGLLWSGGPHVGDVIEKSVVASRDGDHRRKAPCTVVKEEPLRWLVNIVSACLMAILIGCGSTGNVQNQTSDVLIDSYRSPTHEAAAYVSRLDRSLIYTLDGGQESSTGYHPIDGSIFTPTRIVNVFDLPGEVAMIVVGRTAQCGIRYEMILFHFAERQVAGIFFGSCGVQYDFSSDGSSLQAIQVNADDPEVISYIRPNIYGPTLRSALNEGQPNAIPTPRPQYTPPPYAPEAGLTRPPSVPSAGSSLTPEQAEIWELAKADAITVGFKCGAGAAYEHFFLKQKSHGLRCFAEEWVESMWHDVDREQLRRAICSNPDILQRIPAISPQIESDIVYKVGC